MRIKQVLACFAALCLLLSPTLFAQNADVLAQEYDKAFYAGNYSVALPLIESLLAISPDNPDYQRERIKMLALLDREADFLDAFRKLREKESDSNFKRSEEIVKFKLLPEKYLELLKADAQTHNDGAFLEKFFPNIQLVQNSETKAQDGIAADAGHLPPLKQVNP
jgi:hypothetical protein